MSIASHVNAYRPIGVLLGGPFAPECLMQPEPVLCALLRRRVQAAVEIPATARGAVVAYQTVRHHG